MDLRALVSRCAELEKRATIFYRRLGERFAASPEAAHWWREMSNTEAGHFALLQLAEDWIAMAKAPAAPVPLPSGALAALDQRLAAIEEAAERAECGLAEAVELTVTWEELELPRILHLVEHLPEAARGRVRAGIVGEAEAHYRALLELVRAAGAAGLADRVGALAGQARAALG